MKRVNAILSHKDYNNYYDKIQSHEKDRIFCGHDMTHFLDVARICYILTLEKGLTIAKDVVYASALLHDIGRFVQYEGGNSHEIASADLCPGILKDCGYSEAEITTIVAAISNHRNKAVLDIADHEQDAFLKCFYMADKSSRGCHSWPAESQCNWDLNKKNMSIEY